MELANYSTEKLLEELTNRCKDGLKVETPAGTISAKFTEDPAWPGIDIHFTPAGEERSQLIATVYNDNMEGIGDNLSLDVAVYDGGNVEAPIFRKTYDRSSFVDIKRYATAIEWDVDDEDLDNNIDDLREELEEYTKGQVIAGQITKEYQDDLLEDFDKWAKEAIEKDATGAYYYEDLELIIKYTNDLPEEVEIPEDVTDFDVADWLSDTYAFCVKGYHLERR